VGFLLVAVAVAWVFGAVHLYVSLVDGDEGPTELTHQVVSAVNLPARIPLASTGAAVPPPLPAASRGCPSPYWRPQPDLDSDFSIPYEAFGPRRKACHVCYPRLLSGKLVLLVPRLRRHLISSSPLLSPLS
jgi:hypothetical protein